MSKTFVSVNAAANIALVKYWGKKPGPGNQPATGSLSIGLEDLRTETTLEIIDAPEDQIDFDGPATARERLVSYFDEVRRLFNLSDRFKLQTANNFPTGTGLASSASGFAALAMALNELLQLDLEAADVSRLAMRGSGSAARSVYGGFVETVAEQDAFARQIRPTEHWPLAVLVAITDESAKRISSTDAMQQTAHSSPYYQAWLDTHRDDMVAGRAAVENRDFDKLALVAEASCLKMHASIMTSVPAIIYWHPATLSIIHCVQRLRESGLPCFFTIDAGAQVKVICEPESLAAASAAISDLNGVQRLITTRLGGEPSIQ